MGSKELGPLLSRVEDGLGALRDPVRAVHEKRYLKSALEHLGVSVPALRRVAKDLIVHTPSLDRPLLLELVSALWSRSIHEHRAVAVELLDLRSTLLCAPDLETLERFLRESRTWALVDNLAAGPAADLWERNPSLGTTLDRWARDPDFWLRRAALLVLLPALRRGAGDFDRFGHYADVMLEEREFFVRKAIGWVLRDTGRRRPELVAAWLLPRARRASGLTVREAVRHLPTELRDAILAERR